MECAKDFGYRSTFLSHMRTHTDKSKYHDSEKSFDEEDQDQDYRSDKD